MIPIQRFINKKPKVWGVPYYAFFMNAFGVGTLVFLAAFINPILCIGLFVVGIGSHIGLCILLKNKPDNYLVDISLFYLEQGLWERNQDRFRTPEKS